MFSTGAVLILLLAAGAAELSGHVVDPDGKPIAKAIVVVSTAKPRVGPATTCPSCYRDCTKRTITDAEGKFSIPQLSSGLLFSLAAGAPGFQGEVSEHFDPAAAPEIKLQLESLPSDPKVGRVVGKVVDLSGEPIVGAEVRSHNIFRDNGIGGGSDPTVTPLTLTDSEGHFEMSVGRHIQWIDLRVSAAEHAPAQQRWSRSDEGEWMITLGAGAGLRGKLVLGETPVAGVEIGLVQKNRMMGAIVTPQEVFTDETGAFAFDLLPPGLDYAIYTHTDQDAAAVLPVSLVEIPEHGQAADLGEIQAQHPRRLTITVTTTDGSPLPKDSYVYVGRRYGWRGAQLKLEQRPTCTVTLTDVGAEEFEIALRTRGYEVSETSPKLNVDLNNSYSVDTSTVSNVVFMVSPVSR